jgi:predicted amidohydrolase
LAAVSVDGQQPSVLRIACAHLENVVGDIEGNAAQIASAMDWAEGESADVLVLPELALTGYRSRISWRFQEAALPGRRQERKCGRPPTGA